MSAACGQNTNKLGSVVEKAAKFPRFGQITFRFGFQATCATGRRERINPSFYSSTHTLACVGPRLCPPCPPRPGATSALLVVPGVRSLLLCILPRVSLDYTNICLPLCAVARVQLLQYTCPRLLWLYTPLANKYTPVSPPSSELAIIRRRQFLRRCHWYRGPSDAADCV